jgi:hypothetical protein
MIKAELVVALSLWAVLRIIDFMLGGPRRRSQKAQLVDPRMDHR